MRLSAVSVTVMSQPLDDCYDALADSRRRRLLFGLLEENPQTDSPIDLDTPPDPIVTDEAARIEHRHVHLPKLDDYGFVEWTPSLNCVETGPRFEEIRPILESLADHHGQLTQPR